MRRKERDILYTPDGEIRVIYPSGVDPRQDLNPKLTIRLVRSGLVPRGKTRQARYGIFGDPGR